MIYTFRRAARTIVCNLLLATLVPLAGAQIRWRSGAEPLAMQTPAEVASALARTGEPGAAAHLVVQFAVPLTPEQRAALESLGIGLSAYLGDNAFFASFAAGGVDAAAVTAVAAPVHVSEIDPLRKEHPFLAAGHTPTWAVVPADVNAPPQLAGETWIAAYMLFHEDVPLAAGRQVAEAHSAVVRSELRTVNGLVIELPLVEVDALAAEDAVLYIEPALPPFMETNNSNRAITGADIVQAAPYNLDGSGVTVMVYDGGYALASHVDFQGRLTVRDASGLSSHATHVSGTIGGAGVANPLYKGMAPGVTIESYGFEQAGGLHQGFLYSDPGDLEADYGDAINNYGADISNNSIGTNTASNGFPCTWEGDYGVTSSVIDAVVRGSLSAGEPYRIIWANGNERFSGRCGTLYHTTAPPACAKNHITVGALNSNDDSVTTFTSWGPADDGRMKPDVSAPGCEVGSDNGVTSCSAVGTTSYTTFCGTSMACPTVTGLSSLILQDYRAQFPGQPDPRNSTLKVLLAHNAQDIVTPGPDYQSGYGSVRIQPTIDFLRTGQFAEDQVDQGGVVRLLLVVDPNTPEFKVTMAWDDPPGTPLVNPALVNDLDLVVLDPSGTQHFPWTLGGLANPSAPAVQTQANHVDNIEQVFVAAPVAGVWTVEVHGYNVPQGPQVYSIATSPGATGDCNGNGVNDLEDIANGTSQDCNANSVPDECEPQADCNNNDQPDFCDIFDGTSADCNGNGVPDECEADCNGNGVPDDCDIATGTSPDCNGNGIPDECDLADGLSLDCNGNGVPDECDIAGGASPDCNGNGVPDECDIASGASNDCNGNGVPDECDSDCNGNGVPDDCDVANGTSTDCNNNLIPDECEPDCNGNGIPDDCDIASGFSQDANGDGFPDECDTLYVNVAATGDASGFTWDNAFTDLDAALTFAASNAGIAQVWVATGVYSVFGNDPNDPNFGADPNAFAQHFDVPSGVALYGGFAGGETSLSQRDPQAHPTVLTGWNLASLVVRMDAASASTILDGFEIADGFSPGSSGGGLLINGGAPTIRNCVIRDSFAWRGAGAAVLDASPTFDNCTFQSNYARSGDGGAIYIDSSTGGNTVTISNCSFIANRSQQVNGQGGSGGAIYNTNNTTLLVTDSTFSSNACLWTTPLAAQTGGAVHNDAPGLVIDRCVFTSNSAQIGGAIYSSADMMLTNSLLAGNLVFDPYDNGPVVNAGQGGAVCSDIGANATMLNCTAVANWSQKKAAVSLDTGLLANCVLWGNEIAPIPPGENPLGLSRQQFLGGASVRYCDIAGLFDGVPGEDPPDPANFPGSTQADPLFVQPPVMTSGGFYTPGDAHVLPGSPTIDSGENASAPSGLTDLDGAPRLFDDPNTPDTGSGAAPLVDMGAYEFGAAAPCPGDVNGDGVVDLTDLAILLANFDATGATREMGDLDGDGVVNLTDLAILLSVFEAPCN